MADGAISGTRQPGRDPAPCRRPCRLSGALGMADSLLELRDVTAGYGPITVLNGVTLTVRKKDRFAIIGRNGMGKTTVLRSIFGLTGWVRGRIVFDGADITGMPPHKRAMLGLGYVPQTRDIFPTLTVEENLVSRT